MEEELNEQAIKLMDEIFPLGHDCAPIADENYPKRQGFVRGFKEAIKLVKNNGVLDDVSGSLEIDKVKKERDQYHNLWKQSQKLKRNLIEKYNLPISKGELD